MAAPFSPLDDVVEPSTRPGPVTAADIHAMSGDVATLLRSLVLARTLQEEGCPEMGVPLLIIVESAREIVRQCGGMLEALDAQIPRHTDARPLPSVVSPEASA